MKLLKRIILLGLIVLIGAGGYIYYGYNQNLKPLSNEKQEIEFSVESGDTVNHVIDELIEDGLVGNKFFTQIYVKINHIDSVQINNYVLSPDLSLKEIFDILQNGNHENLVQETMTIVEGSSIVEIAQELSNHLELTSDQILETMDSQEFIEELMSEYPMLTEDILNENIYHPLEGYLCPETYSLAGISKDLKTYVKLMLDPVQSFVNENSAAIEAKGMTVHEYLSFCSVVENERLYEEDIPMIAEVFYNRLSIGMPMQSDTTVLYALNLSKIDVTYEDLEVDSLYNTYKYPGTPVGPVCNISLATLQACLNPAENDYLYFFACEDGTVLYAATYEEHLKNCEENKWY